MKNYISILTLLLLTIVIISCKKESSPSPTLPSTSKDYSLNVKEKNWTGTFTDEHGKDQYYSVYFKTDNTLQWSESAGDYSGQWSIDENHLKLTVDGPVTGITTDLTGENKMSNIQSAAANQVKTGELLTGARVTLENTSWTGTIGDPAIDMGLAFLADSKVRLTFASNVSDPVIYSRPASGAYIRLDYVGNKYFGIVLSANLIAGTYTSSGENVLSWKVTK